MPDVLPPLCRYCGKPIGKRTKTIMFGSSDHEATDHGWYATRSEKPRTRAEAQRFANHPIVSVRYLGEGENRFIANASIWDGVSYKDDFFCSNEHAQNFAYAVVRSPTNNLTTEAYRNARDTQVRNFQGKQHD